MKPASRMLTVEISRKAFRQSERCFLSVSVHRDVRTADQAAAIVLFHWPQSLI